jgi:photosystem II stability/assembly factor-like uncharacterized protein
MRLLRINSPGLIKYLPFLALMIAVILPSSESPIGQVVEVVVEEPELNPVNTTCPESYWYTFNNDRGHTTYLTLNALNPANSTNEAEWHPVIPQPGYYRVEAYIAAHLPITWCAGQSRTIDHDTTEAHYSIHHATGVTRRSLSQYPLSNQWLNLGEYYFNAGESGFVYLTDLNGEKEFSTTISFSAIRFTFTRSDRPNVYLPLVHYTDPSVQSPPNAGVIQAQGFDACHLPEISEMQTWWNNSPYRFYALYLGGVSLYSECTTANSTWVSAVHQQGWSFVPTWVGPQAPCSSWKRKMSSDPSVAYQEGRLEAQAASMAAMSMGLTNHGLGGTVIYYDMEYFGGANYECRETVKSFMNGWVERLHELGNIAGGYGSRNSYLADWATIAHIPNDVWVASWYTNNYDPAASVYGISWLNGLWIYHQRIRQYTGGHNETWGNIKFNIDSDVADGMVAMPPTKPVNNPSVAKTIPIQDTGWLSADQGWLILGDILYRTDNRGKNWQDISPGSVQRAYFLPSGEAWALSSDNQEHLSLYHSSNGGESWDIIHFPVPLNGTWIPLQLQFTSPTSGWVVLQKQTSQAFDIGILMKTSDGGHTWQEYDLPSAAPIRYDSGQEGWLTDRNGDKNYRTTDSGITWQAATPSQYPKSMEALPEGTTLSGWQAGSLGWSVTSTGNCSGEKSSPDFTCRSETTLLQSLDGGLTWQQISLPTQE